MTMDNAQKLVGKFCRIRFVDEAGVEQVESMTIEDLHSIPLYGRYFIGDTNEVKLEEVIRVRIID